MEKKCAGTLLWAGKTPPEFCELCGGTKDDLCGDYDAQESQWEHYQETQKES